MAAVKDNDTESYATAKPFMNTENYPMKEEREEADDAGEHLPDIDHLKQMPELTQENHEELASILKRNEAVFSKSSTDLGRTCLLYTSPSPRDS